jgi:hypothetical protein
VLEGQQVREVQGLEVGKAIGDRRDVIVGGEGDSGVGRG